MWEDGRVTVWKPQEDPSDLKKWTGPAGRHDAPSPQSSVRRSWTRSLGSQRAARPEGPLLTRSSSKPGATHPAASVEDTVRTLFCIMSEFVAFEFEQKPAAAAQERVYVASFGAFRLQHTVLLSLLWNKWGSTGRLKTHIVHILSQRGLFCSQTSLRSVWMVRSSSSSIWDKGWTPSDGSSTDV